MSPISGSGTVFTDIPKTQSANCMQTLLVGVYKLFRRGQRLTEFENREQEKIYGPLRQEIRGGWK
jgi:hypothetical protein